MDQEMESLRKPGSGTPTFGHFYVMLAVLLIAIAAAAAMFIMAWGRMGDLDKALKDTTAAEADARSAQVKTLENRTAALESGLADAVKRVAALESLLAATRKELVEARTEADRRLTELGKSLEDQARALEEAGVKLNGRIDETRTEFTKKTDDMNLALAKLQEDSTFIINELGKKAEKAYMRFMERKMNEKITEVSTKVDTVKTDLEDQITTTRQRIEQVVSDMGQSIKKTVEDTVKIDFVPSTTDDEEEK